MEYNGISEYTPNVPKRKIQIDLEKDNLINQAGKETLERRYMQTNEKSPQEVLARAACAFSSNDEHAQRLYDYASKQWFMFASPLMSNGGTERGLPISCFLSQVNDSIKDLTNKWQENAYLSVLGGGIGNDYSQVRSKGMKVGRGGTTPGIIPFIKTVDSQMSAYHQGLTRRGSAAIYLDVSHPEIEEFLEIRDPMGTGDTQRKCLSIGFHHAINISDSFMEAVHDNKLWPLIDPHTKETLKEISARELWTKILKTRMETGEPYLHFIDNSNKSLPEELKEKGLKINNSNLCVAPETLLLTKQYGYIDIAHLEGLHVTVWNGMEWSENVLIQKTGEDKELIRISFSDGSSIDCTPEHKFFVQEKYGGKPVEFKAEDLYTDAKLEKFELPEVFLKPEFDSSGYSYGFYAGDGNENYNFSWIYPEKHCVAKFLIGEVSEKQDSVGRLKWSHEIFPNKFHVPLEMDVDFQLSWLAGLLDADGCVIESDSCQNIQLASIKPDFLRKVKLMLQQLGVQSSVFFRRKEGEYALPLNDGSGELGDFHCQEVWLLNINGYGVRTLANLNFYNFCKRLKINPHQNPQRQATKFIKVMSIEKTGRISDTYCATEPKRNRLMFNGHLTGNCNEIFLPTAEDRTAVCCLSSVNLATYEEWKGKDLFICDLLEMLDNVLEVFINKAPKELWRAINSAKKERSVGLGAMGFHSYLQSQTIPMESKEAFKVNEEIFTWMKKVADKTNYHLGKSRGSPEDLKGSGKRFAHMFAIAPNATSSIICGNTSPSIEPFNSNFYVQDTLNGTSFVKNPYLEKLLEEKGLNTQKIWSDITINQGSVQHLNFLNELEKGVFKTAFEIDQEKLVELAAQRQPFICQGQSLNLFLEPGVSFSFLRKLHKRAWELGLKGLYYCRSKTVSRAVKEKPTTTPPPVDWSKVEKPKEGDDECLVCQG